MFPFNSLLTKLLTHALRAIFSGSAGGSIPEVQCLWIAAAFLLKVFLKGLIYRLLLLNCCSFKRLSFSSFPRRTSKCNLNNYQPIYFHFNLPKIEK